MDRPRACHCFYVCGPVYQVRAAILYHLLPETVAPSDLYARPFLESYWDGFLLFGDRQVRSQGRNHMHLLLLTWPRKTLSWSCFINAEAALSHQRRGGIHAGPCRPSHTMPGLLLACARRLLGQSPLASLSAGTWYQESSCQLGGVRPVSSTTCGPWPSDLVCRALWLEKGRGPGWCAPSKCAGPSSTCSIMSCCPAPSSTKCLRSSSRKAPAQRRGQLTRPPFRSSRRPNHAWSPTPPGFWCLQSLRCPPQQSACRLYVTARHPAGTAELHAG